MAELIERVTRYEVSCLPPDNINAYHFTITVEWRGGDLWAVLHHGYCLGTDGEWDYEPRPSSREDDWLETHRFTLGIALMLAKQEAPKIKINGRTAADFLAKEAGR